MALIVVKIGGEVVAGPELAPLCADVKVLVDRGDDVVVVHGGGPQATELAQRLGIPVVQIGGRRVTDADTLDVMKMTLAGKLNVDLCAALCKQGLRPVGLHGASALVIEARKRPPKVVSGGGPDPVDFGHVGDVIGFNLGLIELLWSADNVPVLACIGADAEGNVFNINADIVANQLAAATNADHLFLVTSVPGVLRDVKDPSTRIPTLTAEAARLAISEGTIAGGMIPKVEEALAVLDGGVGAIHILGKLSAGDLVRAVDEPGSVGTSLLS
jgi:acetylglutamate kinase